MRELRAASRTLVELRGPYCYYGIAAVSILPSVAITVAKQEQGLQARVSRARILSYTQFSRGKTGRIHLGMLEMPDRLHGGWHGVAR